MKHLYTDYHTNLVIPALFKQTVDRVSANLVAARDHYGFQAIAVRGISGIGIGSAVSYKTGISLVVVRKPGESSHGRAVEGSGDLSAYVFLDDFIGRGETYQAVIAELLPAKCVLAAVYGKDSDLVNEPWYQNDKQFCMGKHRAPMIAV